MTLEAVVSVTVRFYHILSGCQSVSLRSDRQSGQRRQTGRLPLAAVSEQEEDVARHPHHLLIRTSLSAARDH